MTDPTIGIWISEDGEVGTPDPRNLYRYVGNNPTTEVDPTGDFGIKDILDAPIVVGLLGWDAGKKFIAGEEPGILVKSVHQHVAILPVQSASKDSARAMWRYLSFKYGDDAGKPISGIMFRWSLQDKPFNLTPTADGKFATAIRSCPEYKTVLAKVVANGKSQGIEDINFTSNDLNTAIGRATFEYKDLKKIDNDNYEVKVRIYDRYNFEFHGFLYYGGGVGVAGANNLSWLSQYLDVINGYDWKTEWITETKGKMP